MSHCLKSEAAVKSGGTAVDTSVSVVRRQQGKQTVAVIFKHVIFNKITILYAIRYNLLQGCHIRLNCYL